MYDRLITIEEASTLIRVSKSTLRRWESENKIASIRTEGGHRRYRLSDIQKLIGAESIDNKDRVVIYSRVSSNEQKQKGDLDRQKARVLEYCAKKKYNMEYIFDEVGSGMSDTRTKLLKLFDLVSKREINRVVVEHKDRLTRFNFNIFKEFFKSHGVEIEVIEDVLPKSYEAELVEDMLSLMSSFTAKIYGKRSAENRKKKLEKKDESK